MLAARSSNRRCGFHCQVNPARQQRVSSRKPRFGRSHRLPVVATSEFWWEDEQEFDALTEVLLPKQVVVCTPAACQQHLQQLQPVRFVAAFSSPGIKEQAEKLWEQLGRAGPPLFLKVRTWDTLDEGKDFDARSSSAAEQFWQEVTGQSWRMDLDYGLNKDATLQALTEQLLVVVGSEECLKTLVTAAVGEQHLKADGSSSSSTAAVPAGLCAVEFTGWNQGEQQQQLNSWRQLSPQLVPVPTADAAVQV